jgi:hypothetical protein
MMVLMLLIWLPPGRVYACEQHRRRGIEDFFSSASTLILAVLLLVI